MAINVNQPDFRALASGGSSIPNLVVPGELGLKALALSLQERDAQRQNAIQQARIRQTDEIALRQGGLERAKLQQQADQFNRGLLSDDKKAQMLQDYRNRQLQQEMLGKQLQQRGQDLNYGLGMAQLGSQEKRDQQKMMQAQMKMEMDELASMKKEKLDNIKGFMVQAKLGMDQVKDPAEANLWRNEIVDSAVKEGLVPKEMAKNLKRMPLSGFNNFLNHKLVQLDAVDQYAKLNKVQGGNNSSGMTITRPDGTVINIQEPTGPVKTEAQKDLLNREKALQKLAPIRASFDKDYFTIKGQLGLDASKAAERVEGIPVVETVVKKAAEAITNKDEKERAKYVRDATKYLNSVEQFFQQEYRKPITGAQAAIEELKDLRKSFLSKDMSPSEFRGAIDAILQNYTSETEFKKNVLREGVDVTPGSKELKYNPENKPDPLGIR